VVNGLDDRISIPSTVIAFLVTAVWMLIAAIIAVRQALNYTSAVRAAGVCIPGWLVHVFLLLFTLLRLRSCYPISDGVHPS
jgi:hypothetical protein